MVGDAVQQGGCHLRVAEDTYPFCEGEVGGEDQRGLFVKLADQVEQQGAAGGWERQVAELVDDHGVGLDQLTGEIAGASLLFLPLQLVDQINGVVEAHALALVDGGDTQSCRDVSFSGAGAADQDQIVRGRHEGGGRQLLDLRLRQRGFGPFDAGQVAMHREAGCLELVAQTADLAIGEFGFDQPVQPGFGLHRPAWALSQQLAPRRGHAVEMQRAELGQAVLAKCREADSSKGKRLNSKISGWHGSPPAGGRSGRNRRAARSGASACRAHSAWPACWVRLAGASRSSPRRR